LLPCFIAFEVVSLTVTACYSSYHVYAAAVLAHYDEAWAKENYENVLLLVRNYANPSQEDTAFPLFRHKDFYNG
jgi:endoglucanase Acf2